MSNNIRQLLPPLPFRHTDFPPFPYNYITNFQVVTERLPFPDAVPRDEERARLERILAKWRSDLLGRGQEVNVLERAIEVISSAYINDGDSINLHGLGLFSLPEIFGIEKFQIRLRVLDLSYNRLSTIPNDIWRLKNLEGLGLAYNNLKVLPVDIGLLMKLRSLNLAKNELTSFPEYYFLRFEALRRICLTSNPILTNRLEVINLKELFNRFQRPIETDPETRQAVNSVTYFDQKDYLEEKKREAFFKSKVDLHIDPALRESFSDLVLPVITDRDFDEIV